MPFFIKLEKGGCMDKKTALYEMHKKQNGKMVSYAGFSLPVQYELGLMEEHKAVRERCGLFDVSHMGEVLVKGKKALSYLNHLLSNDFTNMVDGQARYSLMLNESGGIIDDLIVYRIKEDEYFVVINASNVEKDVAWMKQFVIEGTEILDVSSRVSQIAIQGPRSLDVMLKCCPAEMLSMKYYHCNFNGNIAGYDCAISKTGYTGESGFEIYCKNEAAVAIWETLLEHQEEIDIACCGLGARDTLRLEAAMPLYGHEMTEELTPYVADLMRFVKMEKEDFVGKKALMSNTSDMIRVGLQVVERGIIREDAPCFVDGNEVGVSTSGTHSPTLGVPIAMALIKKEYARQDQEIIAEVRGRKVKAKVVALPFYKKQK